MAIGALGNLFAAYIVVPLWLESFGARTRPMQLGMILPVAPLVAVAGIAFAVKAIRNGYLWSGLLAILLALTPMPFCLVMFRWAVDMNQIYILP